MKITYQVSTDNRICCFKRNTSDSRNFYSACKNLWYCNCLLSFSFWKSRYLLNDKEKYKLKDNPVNWGWSKRCFNASWSTFRYWNYREGRNASSL